MKYERYLSDDVLALLRPCTPLGGLIKSALSMGIDVQLRRNDTVMFYGGLNRLLSFQFTGHPGARTIRTDADRFFQMHKWVQGQYEANNTGLQTLAEHAQKYLREVPQRACATRCEGRLQNQLSIRFGPNRNDANEWVSIDREVVVEFEGGQCEKDAEIGGALAMANLVGELLTLQYLSQPAVFGSQLLHPFGDELDSLLWDPDEKSLLIIELKYGGNCSGIYDSPRQLAVYTDIWQTLWYRNGEIAWEAIKKHIRQKQDLDLIRQECCLPESYRDVQLKPVLILNDINQRMGCWGKIDTVREAVAEHWRPMGNGGILDGLRIMAFKDESLDDITDKYADWPGYKRGQADL